MPAPGGRKSQIQERWREQMIRKKRKMKKTARKIQMTVEGPVQINTTGPPVGGRKSGLICSRNSKIERKKFMLQQPVSTKGKQLTLENLARCTGFPTQTLTDFLQRGLLTGSSQNTCEVRTFDGLSFLRRVLEIEDAE
jgi:hypothetical protein